MATDNINTCHFSGTCLKTPKMVRTQDGKTYAIFTLINEITIKDIKTNEYVKQVSPIDFVLFGEERCRFLCNTIKQGMKLSIQAVYTPTEIRDKNGKIKLMPLFVIDDYEIMSETEKKQKWTSKSWF